MKTSVMFALVAVATLTMSDLAFAQDEGQIEEEGADDFLNAVVKLEVQTSKSDFVHPWRVKTGGGDGSGVVIAPGRILTCAHCAAGVHIRSVNGVKVRDLRHLVELVDGAKGEFLQLGIDDNNEWDSLMVLDLAALREATPRVMERYRIPADRSRDL